MQIIREHVASKAPAFDDFPGLGVKVFMIRQKDRFGAESNQYAPVYLWPSVKPMWKFIAGDGFRGIVDSFGWTPIGRVGEQQRFRFPSSVSPSQDA